MTDREAAAGLVERLESLADLDSRSGAPLAKSMHEAATLITTLLSELERVGKERDEAEALVAEAVLLFETADMKNMAMWLQSAEPEWSARARAFIEKAKS